MSLSLDFDQKERVRMAVDIVDLIGSHLELRPQGRGYVARCPWHHDQRPSLQVNPQRQTWKCWVCDIGGDVFSYVMRRDGVDFGDALRVLAEKAGIEITRSGAKRAKPGSAEDKATLLAAMRFSERLFFDFLQDSPSEQAKVARQYLADRGIDDESRQRFRIGFGPDEWSWLIDAGRREGISGDVLQAAGLAVARGPGSGHYDMFRGRIMFPIHDLQDRPIAMGGRILPGVASDHVGAKYINGPETKLFSKSRQLYGLNLARQSMQQSGHALVMEGYTDVIAARKAGIEPVVAVLGTALGEYHIELLSRFVDRVFLVLDGDEAGRRRADQVLELFVSAGVDLRVITLPGGADPADYITNEGRAAFETLIASAPDALDHKLATLIDGVDLTRDTHRATAAIAKMLDILAKGRDCGSLRTGQLLVRLSRTFGLPAEQLREDLQRRVSTKRRTWGKNDCAGEDNASGFDDTGHSSQLSVRDGSVFEAVVSERRLEPIVGIDRELFEILIEQPDMVALALEAIDPQWLQNDTARQLMSVYRDLDLAGHECELSTLMSAIENESLKNHVVSLDESIRGRTDYASPPHADRFQSVLTRFRKMQHRAEARRQVAHLESTRLDDDDATEMLLDIIAAQRTQQGIHRS